MTRPRFDSRIMTMITFCFFTYNRDEACLRQAIRALRTAGASAKICVFDDGSAPLRQRPAVAHYEVTHFARRGNLNGRECIIGELMCLAKAARLTGARYVAKVDSDTLVMKPREAAALALEHDADLLGASWHDFSVWGPCYILRASLLPKLQELALTCGPLAFHEDAAMTQLARLAGGRVVILPWEAHFLNGFDYRNRDYDMNRLRLPKAVTFGNRMLLQGGQPHEVVARAMEGALDFLLAGKAFDWSHVMNGTPTLPQDQPMTPQEGIAVIVTCHAAYTRYLPECLTAWDAQQPHRKILVLDDCDHDAHPTWEKVSGDWHHPNQARNAGLSAADGHPWVIHWDADNVPPAGFLEQARIKAASAEDTAGVFYSDVAADDSSGKPRVISDDRCGDPRESFYVDTASLWRREAILHVGGWTQDNNKLDDWDLGRRLHAAGWKLQRLDAMVLMRDHPARRTYATPTSEALWQVRPIGIITLFAGRGDLLQRWVKAVQQIELPPHCGLTVVDDSRDESFRRGLHSAMKKAAPRFQRLTFIDSAESAAPQGYDAVHHHVGRLYSRAIATTPEPVVLTWEDDVFPESPQALRALSDRMQPKQRVAAISAAYRSRENADVAVASLDAQQWKTMPLFTWLGSQVKQVGMVGGGFTLWSRAALEQCPVLGAFTLPDGIKLGWDGSLCRRLNAAGWKLLLHGGVRCDHRCA